MRKTKNKIRRTLIAWAIFLLIGLALYLLGWRGLLWFNMPSRKKYPVRGVDVSHYQGNVDFARLAEQGISFAFIKATEGSGTVDECFAENWQNARAAGMPAGAYHFFSFESAAETQADNFCAAVPQEPDALPPVIDLEYYHGYDAQHLAPETVREMLRVMLSRLREAYGKTPIIYTTTSCYGDYLEGADLGTDYTLWIRSTLTSPPDDLTPPWTFWQYNPRGRLDGYDGDEALIDLNIFRGTAEDFARYAERSDGLSE